MSEKFEITDDVLDEEAREFFETLDHTAPSAGEVWDTEDWVRLHDDAVKDSMDFDFKEHLKKSMEEMRDTTFDGAKSDFTIPDPVPAHELDDMRSEMHTVFDFDPMDPGSSELTAPDGQVAETLRLFLDSREERSTYDVYETVVSRVRSMRVNEEYTFRFESSMTEKILDRIVDAIREKEDEGHHISELILGQPQYRALHTWAHAEYGSEPESLIPVEAIIVVPGPMIHPVIPNEAMMVEGREPDDTTRIDDAEE